MANAVTSNQEGLYKKLEEVVVKYASTDFLRPIANHTQEAFEKTSSFIDDFYTDKANVFPKKLVLDSGCGTGESTLNLSKKFKDFPVIGIDKSAVRLTKAGNARQLESPNNSGIILEEVPQNVFWVRGELLDFWRLALEKVKQGKWQIIYHALYYPNPWPKESEATRRFHLHPIFKNMVELSYTTELRTNWEIYAREFKKAAEILRGLQNFNADITSEKFLPTHPETAFERKYLESKQDLWRCIIHKI